MDTYYVYVYIDPRNWDDYVQFGIAIREIKEVTLYEYELSLKLKKV
jgi:hypothetical protein